MAPKLPPIVLPTGCTPENLRPVKQLLHLTAHRNKNQHRIAKWWSSFSILRRQLGRLVAQLEAPDAMFRARRVEIEQRVEFLREQIVPRCYLAFSAVVADNQYASLGLMLMGCLARVNVLISFPRKAKDEEEEVKIETAVTGHVLPTEDLGEAISREELEETAAELKKSLMTKTPKKGIEKSKAIIDSEMESFVHIPGSTATTMTTSKKIAAEVAESSGVEDAPTPFSPPKLGQVKEKRKKIVEHTSSVSGSKTSTSKPAKKKRKKGGDAFDDLFSSLI